MEYAWIDSQKKSVKVSAPQYIDFMMSTIQNQLDDDSIFPTRSGMYSLKAPKLIVVSRYGVPKGFSDNRAKYLSTFCSTAYTHLPSTL